jgi:hypothetical protein
MTPQARSENLRYRRPSRAVPSSETKEFDLFSTFYLCIVRILRRPLLRPGLGDNGLSISSP